MFRYTQGDKPMNTKTNYMNITKVYSYHGYEQLRIINHLNVKELSRSLMCVLEDELNAFVGNKYKDNKTAFVFQREEGGITVDYIVSFWDNVCRIMPFNKKFFLSNPELYNHIRIGSGYQTATAKDLGIE
jgi:hypothetical protein